MGQARPVGSPRTIPREIYTECSVKVHACTPERQKKKKKAHIDAGAGPVWLSEADSRRADAD